MSDTQLTYEVVQRAKLVARAWRKQSPRSGSLMGTLRQRFGELPEQKLQALFKHFGLVR